MGNSPLTPTTDGRQQTADGRPPKSSNWGLFHTTAHLRHYVPAGEHKVAFEPLSVNEYEKQYKEQQIKYMAKKAAKLGFQLVPA